MKALSIGRLLGVLVLGLGLLLPLSSYADYGITVNNQTKAKYIYIYSVLTNGAKVEFCLNPGDTHTASPLDAALNAMLVTVKDSSCKGNGFTVQIPASTFHTSPGNYYLGNRGTNYYGTTQKIGSIYKLTVHHD